MLLWPIFPIAPLDIFIIKVFKLVCCIDAIGLKLQDDAVGNQKVGSQVRTGNHFLENLLAALSLN